MPLARDGRRVHAPAPVLLALLVLPPAVMGCSRSHPLPTGGGTGGGSGGGTGAPHAELSNLPGNPTNDASLAITVGGVNVERYQYALDGMAATGTFDVGVTIDRDELTGGLHMVAVWGINAAGVAQTEATEHAWLVDTLAPTAPELVLPAAGALVRGAMTVQVACVDGPGGSGVQRISLATDDGPVIESVEASQTLSASIDSTELPDGPVTLQVSCRDRAGNESTASRDVVVDNTPPCLVVSSPVAGDPVADGSLLSGTCVDATSGVHSVEYRFASGPYVATQLEGDAFDASLALSAHGHADVELTVRCVDDAGNEELEAIGVTLDENGPSVLTIDSPGDHDVVRKTERFTGTCFDEGVGADTVEVQIDGGPFEPVDAFASGVWSYTTSTIGLRDGVHTIDVRCTDALGHATVYSTDVTSEPLAVVVDLAHPEVLDYAPGYLLASPDDALVITFNEPIDPESVALRGSLADADPTATFSEGGTVLTLLAPSGWPLGAHDLQIEAEDTAGNGLLDAFVVLLPIHTFHVSAGYGGGASDGSASAPFTTIAAAQVVAGDGDLIKVVQGSYDEQVVLSAGEWILGGYRGVGAGFDQRDPEAFVSDLTFTSPPTILDGVVECGWGGGARTRFDGFSVHSDPDADRGYGVFVYGTCAPTLSNLTVEAGTEGVYVYSSQTATEPLVLEDSTIDVSFDGMGTTGLELTGAGPIIVRRNEVSGGDGTSSTGVRVGTTGSLAMTHNIIDGGIAAVGGLAGAGCPTSEVSNSVGVTISNATEGTVVLRDNEIRGFRPGLRDDDVCGLSDGAARTVGLSIVGSNAFVRVEGNLIHSGNPPIGEGGTCNALDQNTAALYLNVLTTDADSDVLVEGNTLVVDSACDAGDAFGVWYWAAEATLRNNVILVGNVEDAVGVRVEARGGPSAAVLYNDTIVADAPHGLSAGISGEQITADDLSITVSNNLVRGFAYGVQMPDVDVVEVRNSGFDGIGTALYDDGAVGYTTVTAMEAHLMSVGASTGGNVEAAIDFVDLDGDNDDLMTTDDDDLRLAEDAACELREGGLDGASEGWDTRRDADRYVRSEWLTCGPTNAGAGGWSMGAFELR